MKNFGHSRALIRMTVATGVALVMVGGLTSILWSAEPTSDSKDQKPSKKTEKKLTGAELYAINCSRCHPERYPTEWNPGQWKTVMTHMRVRANLPAAQAKQILKYLQEDSGN
jgi:mono/diheme cytochrome c family protein